MSNSKKLKVAIVCHFSNEEVRRSLPLGSNRLYVFGRKLLRLPAKRVCYGDISPWVSYLLSYLKKRDDLELHVISSHKGLKKSLCSFESENIQYSFVKCEWANMLKYVVKSPKLWHAVNPIRAHVRRAVRKVNPDIITLIGAENGFIADSVRDLFKYPVLIQCQTIYNNPDRQKYDHVDPVNAYVERELFKKARYVAIPTQMHKNLFDQMENHAIVVDWKAKNPFAEVKYQGTKEYDFVTFAVNMSKKKGYFDAIKAFAIVHESYPNATLNLVGGGSATVKEELKSLCEELHVSNNVIFTPFFEKQSDLFIHIQKSRYALLPSKLDNISGTMIQALYYGLPLVCYETEGTPSLNRDYDCALIAAMNDTHQLAEKMMLLLKDDVLYKSMKENTQKFANAKKNSMEETTNRLVETYKAIYENFYNGVEIPKDLLFNPNATR